MSISLNLRSNQSTPLTWAQLDGNFEAIANVIGVDGGTTAQRPAIPILFQQYVDTDLNKPIWCTQITPSIIWIDATGTIV